MVFCHKASMEGLELRNDLRGIIGGAVSALYAEVSGTGYQVWGWKPRYGGILTIGMVC